MARLVRCDECKVEVPEETGFHVGFRAAVQFPGPKTTAYGDLCPRCARALADRLGVKLIDPAEKVGC